MDKHNSDILEAHLELETALQEIDLLEEDEKYFHSLEELNDLIKQHGYETIEDLGIDLAYGYKFSQLEEDGHRAIALDNYLKKVNRTEFDYSEEAIGSLIFTLLNWWMLADLLGIVIIGGIKSLMTYMTKQRVKNEELYNKLQTMEPAELDKLIEKGKAKTISADEMQDRIKALEKAWTLFSKKITEDGIDMEIKEIVFLVKSLGGIVEGQTLKLPTMFKGGRKKLTELGYTAEKIKDLGRRFKKVYDLTQYMEEVEASLNKIKTKAKPPKEIKKEAQEKKESTKINKDEVKQLKAKIIMTRSCIKLAIKRTKEIVIAWGRVLGAID